VKHPAPEFKRRLRRGDHGNDVIALQRALHKAGIRRGKPSSHYRGPTADQVHKYKHHFNLTPADGDVCGKRMWSDLIHRGFFDGYDVWLVAHEPDPTPQPSDERLAARHAAAVAYALRGSIGYDQQRPMLDMDPLPNLDTIMDCSEFWKWCRRCGGMSPGDNYGWAYGNTESLKQFGHRITSAQLRIADAAFYGVGSTSDPFHMALYAGGGMVYSHGSSAGPYFLPMGYRTVRELRTYEPLPA
jgi:hypothetical protein